MVRNKLKSLVLLIISITLIVVIHEFGHFSMAHLFGVQTPVFSVGFGPALIKYKTDDTTFQIAALPLGGYVSMNMRQLEQIPYWQKMIIMFAGIINNILLAFAALLLLFLLNRSSRIPIIKHIHNRSPAKQSGLHKGDHIAAIDHNPTTSAAEIMHTIQHAPNKTIMITVQRNHETLDVPVTLSSRALIGTPIGYLGIEFAQDPNRRTSITESIKTAWHATVNFISYNAQLITHFFKKNPPQQQIDLSLFTAKSIQSSFGFFLFFIAFTSIQIGLFNLLPIPMLDGGQAFDYTLEALVGHALTSEQISMIHYLLLFILIIIILIASRRRKK